MGERERGERGTEERGMEIMWNLPHATVATPAKLGALPVDHLAGFRETQVRMAEDHSWKEHSEQS